MVYFRNVIHFIGEKPFFCNNFIQILMLFLRSYGRNVYYYSFVITFLLGTVVLNSKDEKALFYRSSLY